MNLSHKQIKKLINKEEPVILELGSHKGFDTKRFLAEFKYLTIYCFEPDPRCIKEFKKSINDNRCKLIEAAVSDIDGKTSLHMSGGYNPGKLSRLYNLLKTLGILKYFINTKEEWDFSSSIKKAISNSKKYPWLNFHQKVEVNTIKLDTWLKENNINRIDLIWADIQGAEKNMIEGGINTLKIVNYLYIEYGETETYPEALTRDETINFLRKHNFEIIDKYSSKNKRGDLLFKNRFYS